MRYLVVGLEYGCEVQPVLELLRETFPGKTFTDEGESRGFTLSRSIYVAGQFDAKDLDAIRACGVALRSAFKKGFMSGWNDHAKHGAI